MTNNNALKDKHPKINKPAAKAFTLVELLVVIVIVAIVAAILLPVLNRAKLKATVSACMNCQKQLISGWSMYASDRQDHIVGLNDGSPDTDWVVNPEKFQNAGINVSSIHVASPAPGGYAEANITYDEYGYRVAALYPFCPKVDIMHCPGDLRTKQTAGCAYRSYSGADGLDGEPGNTNSFKKTTAIKHPADRFVFIEENDPSTTVVNGYTLGENEGTWKLIPEPDPALNPAFSNSKWYDGPAVFHGNSSTLSFADGHVENHRWLDAGTIQFAASTDPNKGSTQAELASFALNPDDLAWICSKYANLTYNY